MTPSYGLTVVKVFMLVSPAALANKNADISSRLAVAVSMIFIDIVLKYSFVWNEVLDMHFFRRRYILFSSATLCSAKPQSSS